MTSQHFVLLALISTQFMYMITLADDGDQNVRLLHEHGQAMSQVQENTTIECPLKSLSLLNYDPHCFDGVLGDAVVTAYNFTMPFCCGQVFAGLAKLMAENTKETGGGTLFLTRQEEELCFEELENVSECGGVASRFVAGESACAFESMGELVAQLNKLAPPISSTFEYLVHACAPLPQLNHTLQCDLCSSSFDAAVALLSTSLHDASYVCASALFLALASTHPSDPLWTTSLYSCAQQHLSYNYYPSIAAPNQQPILSPTKVHKFPWPAIIIGIVLGVLGGIVALVFYQKSTRKNSKAFHEDFNPQKGTIDLDYTYDDSTNFIHNVGLYTFSREEIMNATNQLSEDNVLGEGTAGKVFKGVLPSGQFVAVKQIDKDTKPQDFKRELDNISKVRHAHLVALMGFCQTNDAYYLVYEYCSKGDLSKWLFVAKDDARVLTWEQRVRIAVNSARGLWFLHYYPGGSIVHRDIKPTNILLTEHLEAKLSDFGLARCMETDMSHVLTEVKGTTGYLDPEYMSMGELTQASDVYAFGIVLLQLISGRRAIDLDPHHRLSLVKTAKLIASTGEDLRNFADPRLQGCYSSLAMLKMFRVAIACIASSRHERLTMKEVLQNLEDVSQISFYSMSCPTLDQDDYEHMYLKSFGAISSQSP